VFDAGIPRRPIPAFLRPKPGYGPPPVPPSHQYEHWKEKYPLPDTWISSSPRHYLRIDWQLGDFNEELKYLCVITSLRLRALKLPLVVEPLSYLQDMFALMDDIPSFAASTRGERVFVSLLPVLSLEETPSFPSLDPRTPPSTPDLGPHLWQGFLLTSAWARWHC
jgi:hypothetical protein